MKRTALVDLLIAIAFATLLLIEPAGAADSLAINNAASAEAPHSVIPPTLFGMHVHMRPTRPQPWPPVPVGTFRFADTVAGWFRLNPAEGKYDWTLLDEELEDLKSHNVDDVLFTFHSTPAWASSGPHHRCAHGGLAQLREGANINTRLGSCDPPNDLNPDGSGTDQHWKDFVSALATHNLNSKAAHIKYWEVWNEPHNDFFWDGTDAQMVRMARDAYTIIKSIDPEALILSPSVGMHPRIGAAWMDSYLAAGGGQYADIIAFHGYVHALRSGRYPSASDPVQPLSDFRKMLARHGQDSKPLWDTEASWGNASNMDFTDEEQQSAFLAQFYLLHWSLGVPRLYWFAWNDGAVGTLWIPDPGDRSAPGTLTKAAGAYAQVYKWLVGAALMKPCSEDGGVWTCSLREADGHEAEIVWSAEGEKQFNPKTSLKKMRDLDGNVNSVQGAIKIREKPILIEAP